MPHPDERDKEKLRGWQLSTKTAERGKDNVPARMQRTAGISNHGTFERYGPEGQKRDEGWR